jgi:peptide/nickel transport system ATP-binding protein
MSQTLLRVEELRTWIDTAQGPARAVDGVSFTIERGQTFALLGESGCGKSITALSIVRLHPEPAARIVSGRVLLDGRDLLALTESQMRDVRGKRIAMIFQEPQTSLNPVLTIGAQIAEAVPGASRLTGRELQRRVVGLLDSVGIADSGRRYGEYPHQLSGGMKQRAMIAMALAAEPALLIADEPTTALDVTIQAQILDLLKEQQRLRGMAMLLITHDLGVVSKMADHVAVMYAGEIVESSPREEFFTAPRHPYTRKLFQSVPSRSKRRGRLEVIAGSVPPLTREFEGCRFADRCEAAWALCAERVPAWREQGGGGVRCHLFDPAIAPPTRREVKAADVLAGPEAHPREDDVRLRVQDLRVYFPIHRGLFKRVVGHVKAVDGVSLEIHAGRTLALVGESGSGKTTVGKGILQLLPVTGGRVQFGGQELTQLSAARLRTLRGRFQVIFQDPYASLDPRMRVGAILEEGMRAQGVGADGAQRQARIAELLSQVGLAPEAAQRYPHEFSGGQRQRVAIARALAVNPELIVCDEPTSALDVSVQAQILNLLKSLQDRIGLSYLFITHNISVVEYLAHDVAILYLGRLVESGPVQEVLERPRHPYTQALLSAVPTIEPGGRAVIRLQGDMPSPSAPPTGCHFHPRCTQATEYCRRAYPSATQISAAHRVHCHLYGDKADGEEEARQAVRPREGG